MPRLTAEFVSALPMPKGKTDHIEFDDVLKGFGFRLRAGAGGAVLRSWVVQYRRAGRTRRVLLGSAAVLTAIKARAAAEKTLAAVTLGQDPQADRVDRRAKDQLLMRAVVDEYLAAKQAKLRPRSLFEFRRYLAGPLYFKPLQSLPIDTITRKDIAACLVVIARKSSGSTASHARTVLNAFFSWCLQMGYIEANPVIGTIKPEDGGPRHRVLTDPELAAILRACGDDDYGRVVRLLTLTGCRRQEIGGMCWGELDAERGVLVIPAERSKNDAEHTLPLPPMAWDIIAAVPRMANRDQLFGARTRAGFTAWADAKADLDRRLGSSVAPFVLHDIRRSVATGMANLGVQPHVIEQILNHKSGHKSGIAGVYNRSSYQREVKAALALWADHIRALVEGGECTIIPFTPAAAT
jgi:integrase